jgi:hypothetical protein
MLFRLKVTNIPTILTAADVLFIAELKEWADLAQFSKRPFGGSVLVLRC